MCSCPDFLLVLLSIIFPPLGVLLRRGCCADFLINCGLTALGYVPGLIHAWYIICKYPPDEYEMLVDDGSYPQHGHHHHVVVISHERTPVIAAASAPPPIPQPQGEIAPPPYQAIPKDPSHN
ncbi:hypothetical protein GGI12_004093 [Dipsacomyces acuminosporus]|nr:hypothetical protein GGI12_004093 [Dipsacomyces acuminosporus]